jgi:CspA family cold shock protein
VQRILLTIHFMMEGTIKNLNEKAFGFISPDDGSKDYFFHKSDLLGGIEWDQLQRGQRVSFEVEESPKGPKATKVSLI